MILTTSNSVFTRNPHLPLQTLIFFKRQYWVIDIHFIQLQIFYFGDKIKFSNIKKMLLNVFTHFLPFFDEE